MSEPTPERLLDPDCRDGKCGSCIGGPCEHDCHTPPWMLEDAGIHRPTAPENVTADPSDLRARGEDVPADAWIPPIDPATF